MRGQGTWGQGDKGTGDKGTRGQGDKGTRGQGTRERLVMSKGTLQLSQQVRDNWLSGLSLSGLSR